MVKTQYLYIQKKHYSNVAPEFYTSIVSATLNTDGGPDVGFSGTIVDINGLQGSTIHYNLPSGSIVEQISQDQWWITIPNDAMQPQESYDGQLYATDEQEEQSSIVPIQFFFEDNGRPYEISTSESVIPYHEGSWKVDVVTIFNEAVQASSLDSGLNFTVNGTPVDEIYTISPNGDIITTTIPAFWGDEITLTISLNLNDLYNNPAIPSDKVVSVQEDIYPPSNVNDLVVQTWTDNWIGDPIPYILPYLNSISAFWTTGNDQQTGLANVEVWAFLNLDDLMNRNYGNGILICSIEPLPNSSQSCYNQTTTLQSGLDYFTGVIVSDYVGNTTLSNVQQRRTKNIGEASVWWERDYLQSDSFLLDNSNMYTTSDEGSAFINYDIDRLSQLLAGSGSDPDDWLVVRNALISYIDNEGVELTELPERPSVVIYRNPATGNQVTFNLELPDGTEVDQIYHGINDEDMQGIIDYFYAMLEPYVNSHDNIYEPLLPPTGPGFWW